MPLDVPTGKAHCFGGGILCLKGLPLRDLDGGSRLATHPLQMQAAQAERQADDCAEDLH